MPDDMILLNQIEEARGRNNKLWMEIVRTALLVAPHTAKHLLRQINENDKMISEKLAELANVP